MLTNTSEDQNPLPTQKVPRVEDTSQQMLTNTSEDQDPLPPQKVPRIEDANTNFFLHNLSLLQYLQTNPKCKSILQSYDSQNHFDDVDRRKLTHLIIDGLLERHQSVRGIMFVELAGEIVKIFPTESKECYYNHAKVAGKNSTGKLVDRYRNDKKYTRKATKALQKKMKDKEAEAQWKPSEDVVRKVTWLRHSLEPWSKVAQFWSETSELRFQDRLCASPVHEMLDKWPSLKHDLGYTLVSVFHTFSHWVVLCYAGPVGRPIPNSCQMSQFSLIGVHLRLSSINVTFICSR
jgi:hypothetical protein